MKSYITCIKNDRIDNRLNENERNELNVEEEPLNSLFGAILENPETPNFIISLTEIAQTSVFFVPKEIVDLVFSNIAENKFLPEMLNFVSSLCYFPRKLLYQTITIENFAVLVNGMLDPQFIRPITSIIDVYPNFKELITLSGNLSQFMEMITNLSLSNDSPDQFFIDSHFFIQKISLQMFPEKLLYPIIKNIARLMGEMPPLRQKECLWTLYTFFYYHRENVEDLDIALLFTKIEENFNNENEDLVNCYFDFLHFYEKSTDDEYDYDYDYEEEEYTTFAEDLFYKTDFIDAIMNMFEEASQMIKKRILRTINYFVYEVPSAIDKICQNGFVDYLLGILADSSLSIATPIVKIFSCCIAYGNPCVAEMFLEKDILKIFDDFVINTSDEARIEISRAMVVILSIMKRNGQMEIFDHIRSLESLIEVIETNESFIEVSELMEGGDESD